MQSIEISGLTELSKRLNDLLDEAPEARKKLHEELAEMTKQTVDSHIALSGVHDDKNKIKDWQEEHVGSGGGYAAVRASSESTGDNSPGAITNYLESGHAIRQPSGKSKRYKPDINVPYVDGRHFYQSARKDVMTQAVDRAEKFAEELAKKIKG